MSEIRSNPSSKIHPILATRWSPRAFDAQQTVESTKLSACLEAARWASSCYGEEPWRFIVADRSTHPQIWQKLFATLAEPNQVWAKDAPILLLACAADNFSQNNNPNRWAAYDVGQAMMSFSLQAVAEGLISHPMGGFDPEQARQAFAIPEGFTAMSITALGYPGDSSTLPEHYQQIETAERHRKPLSETTFTSWGEAWSPA